MPAFDPTSNPADSLNIEDIPIWFRYIQQILEDVIDNEHDDIAGNYAVGDASFTGGRHTQGSARPFFQSESPATRVDGTAFTSADYGSIWIDSDDNKVYILTDSLPTWTLLSTEIITTLLASARTFLDNVGITSTDARLVLTNTTPSDAYAARANLLLAKGTQSGNEVTTLGYLQFTHDGASDDQKGRFAVILNSGAQDDAPTTVPIVYGSDGKIVVAESLSVLDEDDLASDDAACVATQQSIKAYVDSSAVGFNAASVLVLDAADVNDTDWHEYDLSGTIGSNVALCVFEAYAEQGYSISVRAAAGTDYEASNGTSCASSFKPGSGGSGGTIMCLSNSSGIIDYRVGNAALNAATLKLVGFFL